MIEKTAKGLIVKKLVCLVLASMLVAPAALAKNRYIADNLFTYMHSGRVTNSVLSAASMRG